MPREIQSSKHPAVEPARLKNHVVARSRMNMAEAAKILQLIEAAEDIFLAKGYHTATMSDVAKAAGMSKKTVYQLIESKADLFAILLEHRQEQIVIPNHHEDWPLQEILVQYLLGLAQFLLSPKQISIIRLILAEYTHGKDFGRIFHQKRVTKANLFLENCLMQVVPPTYKPISDYKEMAAMLFGMALGEFHLGVLLGFRAMPTKAALTNRIRLAVELFLKGCEVAEEPQKRRIPERRKPVLKKSRI
jgi:TetR/AcrR family transcriptional repressor of mexJK operon